MKKILVLLATVVMLYAQQPSELRGVWLTNISSSVLTSRKNAAIAMDYLSSIGVNVVFPVVWNDGRTLYPSNVMNKLFGTSTNIQDALGWITIEAHRNGIEVIPWIEYGFSCSYSQNGGTIITKYPDWALKTSAGALVVDNGFDWMSGIHPDVQNFMIALSMEMINNYDLDGIQGDDRLPAMPVEGGYEDYTKNLYKTEKGTDPPTNNRDAAWMKWRADKLNVFFQRLRDSVKNKSQNLILSSASTPYSWGYPELLQDSKTWLSSGIVDNFIPQVYPDDRLFATYKSTLSGINSYVPSNKKDIFFSGMLTKVGTYQIDTVMLKQCIDENRKNNVKGETFFFYEGIANTNSNIGKCLKNNYYSKDALLPYRNGKIWRPKAVIVNEDESAYVTKSGSWVVKTGSIGFKPNVYWIKSPNYASLTYNINVPYDGWFSVYFFNEAIMGLGTTKAPFTYYNGTDSVVYKLDQSNTSSGGWFKLGDRYLTKGIHTIGKLENTGVETDRYVMGDAIMLQLNRKLSPNVVVPADYNTSVESELIIPNNFEMEQNYPNPFNPTTTIRYSLTNSTYVTLKIYDILGSEVATLVNSEQKAGEHSLLFNGLSCASGVYLAVLNAGGVTKTIKMNLIK